MAHDDKTDPPVTASRLALAIEEDLRCVEGIAAVLRHLGEGRELSTPAQSPPWPSVCTSRPPGWWR